MIPDIQVLAELCEARRTIFELKNELASTQASLANMKLQQLGYIKDATVDPTSKDHALRIRKLEEAVFDLQFKCRNL